MATPAAPGQPDDLRQAARYYDVVASHRPRLRQRQLRPGPGRARRWATGRGGAPPSSASPETSSSAPLPPRSLCARARCAEVRRSGHPASADLTAACGHLGAPARLEPSVRLALARTSTARHSRCSHEARSPRTPPELGRAPGSPRRASGRPRDDLPLACQAGPDRRGALRARGPGQRPRPRTLT